MSLFKLKRSGRPPARPLPSPEATPYTMDEALTAAYIVAEGTFKCRKMKGGGRLYSYPVIRIAMCDRQALEPVSRVFRTSIKSERRRKRECPPHLFPPDGMGSWVVEKVGWGAIRLMERLAPLMTGDKLKGWEEILRRCSLGT